MALFRKEFKSKPRKSKSKVFQRDTHSIGRMPTILERVTLVHGAVGFYALSNFIQVGGIFLLFQARVGIPRNWDFVNCLAFYGPSQKYHNVRVNDF